MLLELVLEEDRTPQPAARCTGPVDREEVDKLLDKLPELERVAFFYRLAYFLGFPPTAAVATEMGITHAVAAKRVQAARRAGLLEPTTKGRKGA